MVAASAPPGPPPATPTALERPRLSRRLDDALCYRLTSIVAGAGTGKTTALAHWAARRRSVWHRALPRESHTALMRALIDGLRAHVLVPDAELLLAVDHAGSPDSGTDPVRVDALAGALCRHLGATLAELDDELAIIVDDVHALASSADAAELLAAIVRHAPPDLHLILASREAIPFPTARLVVDGLAQELHAGDLAFTADEIRALHPGATDDGVATLLARTGGWAAAVAVAARSATRPVGAVGSSGPTEPQLSAYLAQEVLATESADTMAALTVAARLPWITPALSDHLGLDDGGRRLAEPSRTNITMTPVAGVPGGLTVTPLVREHLERHPPRLPVPVEVSLGLAAGWYERAGAVAEALTCLCELAPGEQLAGLLERHGRTLLDAGRAGDVAAAIQRLDDAAPAVAEPLGLLWAEALMSIGDVDAAIERYRAVIPARGAIPAAVAWRLGSLCYLRATTDEALDVLGRVELGHGRPADDAAVLAWAAAVHWSRGDREPARKLANDAKQLAEAAGESCALATAYTVLTMIARIDGDSVAHHSYYAQALAHAERAKDLFQIVRIRCNAGSHHTENGEYAKALDELDVAIRLADLGGFSFFRALCLVNRAEVLIAYGRLDEAVADLEPARSIFQRVAPPMDAFPLVLLGEVYLARGDQALALAAFEEAAAIASDPIEIQALVPALIGMAMVAVDDDPQLALTFIRRAADLEATVHHVKALVALGRVTLASGDVAAAAELADRAVALARSRRDRPGLALSLELAATFAADPANRLQQLEDARTLWSELGTPFGTARVDLAIAETKQGTDAVALAEAAARTFDRLGAKRDARRARELAAARLSESMSGVSVRVLGGFAVLAGGVPVPTSAWQSKVARDLFKMLVINRGRPIHREVLIDRLWPGESGEKASNRLSVALSAIRSTTDPDRSHGSDHVVVADRDSVALNVANVSVDVDQFLADAARGQAMLRQGRDAEGLALLRIAEARYAGDVLEESPYADWALPLREEARTMYLSVAGVLADADAAAGDHESAARRYLRMIERDPFSESAYLGAVAALRAAGHHGSAQRLYASYVARMAEIDVEPAMFPAA